MTSTRPITINFCSRTTGIRVYARPTLRGSLKVSLAYPILQGPIVNEICTHYKEYRKIETMRELDPWHLVPRTSRGNLINLPRFMVPRRAW
jgi:hypothetical protein